MSNNRVIAYLCQKRCIDYNLVKQLISWRKLMQDERGNARFIIYDFNRSEIGAEIHGTSDIRFKGQLCSDPGQGFSLFMSGNAVKHICFFESAIDLISFFQIYYNVFSDCLLVSMRGLKPAVVHNFSCFYPSAKCILCVDNDDPAERFVISQQLISFCPSVGKDWNEFLQIRCKGIPTRE